MRHEQSTPTAPTPARKERATMNQGQSKTHRRGALAALIAATALLMAAIAAAPAAAEFGFNSIDLHLSSSDANPFKPGTSDPPATQAGSHPYALSAAFEVNYTKVGSEYFPDERLRNLSFELPPGFSGDATAIPPCSTANFLEERASSAPNQGPNCPDRSAVGAMMINLLNPLIRFASPLYVLEPPPGVVLRLGFKTTGIATIIDTTVKQGGDYNVISTADRATEVLAVLGANLELWGVPADPAHDSLRGLDCLALNAIGGSFASGGSCPAGLPPAPVFTLPTECVGPVTTHWEADSWTQPGKLLEGDLESHDDAVPPNPVGFHGCGKLPFAPSTESKATAEAAETGTGLDFNLDFNDEGLKVPDGISQSLTRKAVIALPEGMTINPSVGEGLGVCTPADLDRETLHSKPGEGCPNSSKVGSLHTEFPIVEDPIDGSIYLAQQDDPKTTEPGAENPFDSLIALYFVLKSPKLGTLVKLPVLVEPDPDTGQLLVTLDDIPQFPFSHFNAHMREGQRSALITPPTCGTHTTVSKLYPRSEPDNPRTVLSSFEITSGPNGAPCPPGGIPPFGPEFQAGATNNNAGSFSPFNMRLQRKDGDQDLTKFASILPPGELGSLAGVDKCPDAAAEAARQKSGRDEQASPSCPANSLIGHTQAGAGVGSALTYVKGYAYLGGPYKGAPLSVISITPAVAGPFDAGTVVVRLGLDLNPKTAEVEVDGAASDPIPHILKGIVLKVRDLQVYVDRPDFTLNPTSCDESSARATVFGSYLDVFDPADDVPVDLSTRYQAANCLNLGFKPDLKLNLKGGTGRGGHPALKAIYTPRKGDANIEGLIVRLPRSAFLDQAHIKTICTRVQFAANNCPKNAQYGYIKAWTPLLDEPLQGPVWLRSSSHKLPDLVFDLHGLVDIEVAVRIDSARGGIRATMTDAPDAPLSRVLLRMQGAKKGLIVNSRDLCAGPSRANVQTDGHNGKRFNDHPLMRPLGCAKRRKHARHARRARLARRSVAG